MRSLLHKLNQRIVRALTRPVHSAAVVALGIFTLVWGLWLLSPFWSAFSSARLYSALNSLAPETFWGGLALTAGVVTIWAVKRHSYHWLRIGGAVAAWHWGMITVFYFIGDWTNTGGITALFLALYAAYIFINVKFNREQIDFEHK